MFWRYLLERCTNISYYGITLKCTVRLIFGWVKPHTSFSPVIKCLLLQYEKHVGVFGYKLTCMFCRWNTENILRSEYSKHNSNEAVLKTQLHVELDTTLHYQYSVHAWENEKLYRYPLDISIISEQGSRQTILLHIQKN